MLQIPKIEIRPYLDIILRRKWWLIVPLVLSLIGGGIYALTSPKLYRATSLILIEGQRIPSSYVTPTVTESLQSRLQTISQQVNSRTNLEQLIKTYELGKESEEKNKYRLMLVKVKDKFLTFLGKNNQKASEEKKDKEVSLAAKVQKVRGNIYVNMQNRNRAFSISFTWHDPEIAARVVNALASQFIEENLKVREEMAMGTTSFLEKEARRLEKELAAKEQALAEFKHEHMGTLPDQLSSNLNILSQLKEDLNNFEKRIETEKQQAMLIESQLQNEKPRIISQDGTLSPKDAKLASMQSALQDLKSQYTDQHPDVVALERRIEKFEKEIAEKDSGASSTAEPERASPADVLKMKLAQVQSKIREYEKKVQELRSQITEYKERVEKTPKVGMQLKDLQRNYGAISSRYQQMVSKKMNAQMSEELEKRQKGEQFRVVDPAVPPGKPFKPDVEKIMFLAVMLGLGLGGGLAFVRESLDPAFYTPEEVEEYLGVEVMVSLPFADHKNEKKG